MNRTTRTLAALLAAGSSLASAPSVAAKAVAPAPSSAPASKPGAKPANDAITLTPFEVKAGESDTYEALNTNSITGTNTLLSKTPLDAKVFNREMMDDLNVI